MAPFQPVQWVPIGEDAVGTPVSYTHLDVYKRQAVRMQPDQAVFLLNDVFLPNLKNEHRLTKAVIEAIPPDQSGYRPDPAARPALELAWHIVATEMRFFNAVAAGAFDFTPMPRPESIKDSADLAVWYTDLSLIHI